MTDGRNLRLQRNRAAMLAAGVHLAADGNWRPTVRQIATHAGVSVRSFFQHFRSLDDYNVLLLETHEASLRAAMWIPPDPLRLIVLGKP